FNYYDTTTLDRTSAFVSFVDSSWLVAGLLVARQALPALAARCDALLAERDFAVFYDPALGRMLHGFYVDPLRRSPFHYGALYTEARLGSLLAIGRGDVPVHHWHAMARTAPPWLPAAAGDEAELLESSRRVPPEQLPDGTFT